MFLCGGHNASIYVGDTMFFMGNIYLTRVLAEDELRQLLQLELARVLVRLLHRLAVPFSRALGHLRVHGRHGFWMWNERRTFLTEEVLLVGSF